MSVENIFQKCFALLRLCHQEISELSLRKNDGLNELVFCQTNRLRDPLIHFGGVTTDGIPINVGKMTIG